MINDLRPTSQYIQRKREMIGKQVRSFREEKGLSQGKLAEIMGISRSTISKIETGKFAFTIDYISKFGWYLDFEITILENQSI